MDLDDLDGILDELDISPVSKPFLGFELIGAQVRPRRASLEKPKAPKLLPRKSGELATNVSGPR